MGALEEDLDDLGLEDEKASTKPLVTTFELNETLFAEAELKDTDAVYLWLGVRSPHRRPFRLDDFTDCDLTTGQCDAILQDPRGHRTARDQTKER